MKRETHAVYVISVAAEIAGVHPQTLRIYERRGLLQPARTSGAIVDTATPTFSAYNELPNWPRWE